MQRDFSICQIPAEETIGVRLPILRAGMSREDAVFPGDEDPETRHFGAFAGGEFVGVVSVYPRPWPEFPEEVGAWQLRGMATTPEVRGSGCGARLLAACEEHVRAAGGRLLWCNARVPAAGFYARHGWRTVGEVFEIPTAGPHVRMMRRFEDVER